MPMTAPNLYVDPLHAFVAGGFVAGSKRPVPLMASRFEVEIAHGLATITATRAFRNAEAQSIEATITFPLPVHAVLLALEARIDGRVLKARAQRQDAARETYERAIDCGQTAVLHEEVLRGVHMLSVGHIAPGAEIEVSTTFATTLTNVCGRSQLRIPLTVGDLYGRSGLPDSDDLLHGGPAQTGELTVRCNDGCVLLAGQALADGPICIPLNAPIDLEVSGWTPADLIGRAADGRDVVLRITPAPASQCALDVAIVIDRSGSMNEICSDGAERLTKHQAVSRALATITDLSSDRDLVDLWEFDEAVRQVGTTKSGRTLQSLTQGLREPGGGTEIGTALNAVVARSEARDVLLITDGKSYALDVQELARSGRRFAVALIGEDSLEANVGHLAALSGGEIFIAAGAELVEVLQAALGSLRSEHIPLAPITGKPESIVLRRAGMTISAEWREPSAFNESLLTRPAAAMAAYLALSALDAETAAHLAEAEGLVTHLTSLVLVDEAGIRQEGIPATRKVALLTPRTAASTFYLAESTHYPDAGFCRGRLSERRFLRLPQPKPVSPHDLSALAARFDWDRAPDQFRIGDLSSLDPGDALAIRDAAAVPELANLADRLNLDAVVLVIALMARTQSSISRSAARLARTILPDETAWTEVETVARRLRMI